MSDMRRCSRCGRTFGHERDLQNHIHDKHLKRGARAVPAKSRSDDDESLADIAIGAELKRAMGMPLDPLEESLLP